jgi:hypothetical protein
MSPMRAAALFLAILIAAPSNGRCLGQAKPWTGGFFLESSGYADTAFLPAASCLGAGLFLEPLALPTLNPCLLTGILLPVAPCRRDAMAVRSALALTLFDARLSWLRRTFYASLAWSPALEAGLLYRADGSALRFTLAASPLRLRAGDGLFTLGSLGLLLDEQGSPRGWGLVLFQAALFLY